MIKNYIQGLCAEKEKEFLEARKTVEKDRARVFARQREERLENERKSGISYIKEQVPITLERASNLPEAIYAEYLELRKKEATYNEFAKKLGIRFNLSINNASIQESIRQIKQNITVMKQKIAELKITDQIQLTDLNDAISTNDKYAKALDSSYSKNSKLKDIVKDYREECILATKKGIDEKAQDMIKRIRLELLRNKKLEIESRKISWFG